MQAARKSTWKKRPPSAQFEATLISKLNFRVKSIMVDAIAVEQQSLLETTQFWIGIFVATAALGYLVTACDNQKDKQEVREQIEQEKQKKEKKKSDKKTNAKAGGSKEKAAK